jgi:hypothetical protein
MKKAAILFLLAWAGMALGQPQISPTLFLNTEEPSRLCADYIYDTYGEEITMFAAPSGGALLCIGELRLYIFCDAAMNKLVIFSLEEVQGVRTPIGIKDYGIPRSVEYTTYHDSVITPFEVQLDGHDCEGCFYRPVDVAVSSRGREFDPETDRIYVLDQGNRRVVELSYDTGNDTLLWGAEFGADTLDFPTALDYANYGDPESGAHDIFVTDGGVPGLFRFSANTYELEDSYCGWGGDLGSMGFPSGVATSPNEEYVNIIYVSDSWNHRVMSYYSESDGPIMAAWWHTVPLANPVPLLTAVATDASGQVYVLDEFHDKISVLPPELDSILYVYGEEGIEPGEFEYPTDIYIDGDEMQVCEQWDEYNGIQSFTLETGLGKRAGARPLPHRFHLSQNYPNPFNPNTTIAFSLPSGDMVKLEIFNILGQRIRVLLDEYRVAGQHSVVWGGGPQDPAERGRAFETYVPPLTGPLEKKMQNVHSFFVSR